LRHPARTVAADQVQPAPALAKVPASNPLARFRAFGLAYLRWATRNPTHFEIISNRQFFNHGNAGDVSRDNAELIGLTECMLAEALAKGQLRAHDLKQVQIAGRALVYGFARMNIDGALVSPMPVSRVPPKRSCPAFATGLIECLALVLCAGGTQVPATFVDRSVT
jgi:hypothetical protein